MLHYRNLYLIDYKKRHPNALKSEFTRAWETLDQATLLVSPSLVVTR